MAENDTPRQFVSNTKQEEPQKAAFLRYVAYNDSAGIFLGFASSGEGLEKMIWSLKDPKGLRTAPTFSSRDEFARYLAENGIDTVPSGLSMKEVYADLDLKQASMEAIRRAALPDWKA